MGYRVGELHWKDHDFLGISCFQRVRLWKSVVTLAVKGNTIIGRSFRRYRMRVYQEHREQLTGSRWDIRMVS
jgi:hypothetical protein